MPYVRGRLCPAAKEYARRRAESNRKALAYDPAHPGARFTGAYDWFRAAAAYAGRRSYRTLEIAEDALARREQIITEAARLLQDRAGEIDTLVPASFRRHARRAALRDAYSSATSPAAQLAAAHGWLLFAARRAERYGSASAAGIKDRAAASLIKWAEEMDADDYGE